MENLIIALIDILILMVPFVVTGLFVCFTKPGKKLVTFIEDKMYVAEYEDYDPEDIYED